MVHYSLGDGGDKGHLSGVLAVACCPINKCRCLLCLLIIFYLPPVFNLGYYNEELHHLAAQTGITHLTSTSVDITSRQCSSRLVFRIQSFAWAGSFFFPSVYIYV